VTMAMLLKVGLALGVAALAASGALPLYRGHLA
jgi:hypothetical protein